MRRKAGMQRRRIPPAVALALTFSIGFALIPVVVCATTYYVRGNFAGAADGNEGTAPGRALRTITAAVARISNPGDVVLVGPGIYREGNIGPVLSGVRGFPITVSGDATGQSTEDDPGAV